MIEHAAHYIGGQWQPSKGTEKIEVVNAATEEVMGSIPAGNAEGLQLRKTEIAMLLSQEVGMRFAYSNVVQVVLPVQSFASIRRRCAGLPVRAAGLQLAGGAAQLLGVNPMVSTMALTHPTAMNMLVSQ